MFWGSSSRFRSPSTALVTSDLKTCFYFLKKKRKKKDRIWSLSLSGIARASSGAVRSRQGRGFGGSSSSRNLLVLRFDIPCFGVRRGRRLCWEQRMWLMLFQGFGMLPEIQESTGTAAQCSSRDLPWIPAEEFGRKRGKYPPSVSDPHKSLPSLHLQSGSLTHLGIKASHPVTLARISRAGSCWCSLCLESCRQGRGRGFALIPTGFSGQQRGWLSPCASQYCGFAWDCASIPLCRAVPS